MFYDPGQLSIKNCCYPSISLLILLFLQYYTKHKNYGVLMAAFFRPPSCMGVSRSYPKHLVQFREKKKKKKSILPPF